jgi:hypothetical protein
MINAALATSDENPSFGTQFDCAPESQFGIGIILIGGKAPDLWLSGDSEMLRIGLGSHRLTGSSGRTLSILPLGPGSGSVRSKGLRWNLDHLDWSETPISLSNRGVSSTIELTVERGSFLVIAPYLDDQLYLSPTFIEYWR